MKLSLGLSTCPNDTFLFHGLLAHQIADPEVELDLHLMDIQELNDRLLARSLDVAKASFHAALFLSRSHVVLPVGSALGFGVGPLLLSSDEGVRPDPHDVVLCPGKDTTATLLLKILHPELKRIEHCNFAAIMPALKARRRTFGVVIHEGRFTYRDHGLYRVEDLGDRWEKSTQSPLPLGGLLARNDLPASTLAGLCNLLRRSLALAHADRGAALQTMRRHASEMKDEILWAHVELYVNDCTRDLGESGGRALGRLHQAAKDAGLLPGGQPPLTIVCA